MTTIQSDVKTIEFLFFILNLCSIGRDDFKKKSVLANGNPPENSIMHLPREHFSLNWTEYKYRNIC